MKASFRGTIWIKGDISQATEVYFNEKTPFHLKKFPSYEEPQKIVKALRENWHPNFANISLIFQLAYVSIILDVSNEEIFHMRCADLVKGIPRKIFRPMMFGQSWGLIIQNHSKLSKIKAHIDAFEDSNYPKNHLLYLSADELSSRNCLALIRKSYAHFGKLKQVLNDREKHQAGQFHQEPMEDGKPNQLAVHYGHKLVLPNGQPYCWFCLSISAESCPVLQVDEYQERWPKFPKEEPDIQYEEDIQRLWESVFPDYIRMLRDVALGFEANFSSKLVPEMKVLKDMWLLDP
ncbi:unnamed protein product [Camellia sinensis]